MSNPAADAGAAAGRWHVLAAGFLCYEFDALDFMVLALALPAVSLEWHLSFAQPGLLGTAGMVGMGISGALLGWYADNYGRRRALRGSVVTCAVVTAPIGPARDRYDMKALRFLAGIGLGGVWGVVSALIHENWSAAQRARAIAVVLSAWPVGLGVAALLTRLFVPTHGWRILFACGASALLAALYVLRFVPESAQWLAEQRQPVSRGASRAPVHLRELFAPDVGASYDPRHNCRGLCAHRLLGQ